MELNVDLAIIGAGPGGYSTALRAAELGAHVTLIERDAVVGGTCLQRGCIPTKTLISAVRTIDEMNYGREVGIEAHLDAIDFGKLRDHRTHIVDEMTHGLEGLLASRGIRVFRGDAALQADGSVLVTPSDGRDAVQEGKTSEDMKDVDSSLTIHATDVVLALGSHPTPLPGIPFNGALIDSTQALALNTVPHNAVIIGSGSIALEFASLLSTAGCETTLLIRHDHVLTYSDRRSAIVLNRELKRHGVNIITGTQVTGVDTSVNLGATVHYSTANEQDATVRGEIVLAAIGRMPNTDQEWLKGLPITIDDHGVVQTDPYGRTSMDHVWALGDITAGPMLAHHAFEQGYVIAETIAGLNPRPVNEMTVPSVIFSNPEFASVGVTAQQAKTDSRFLNVKETLFPVMANARMLMTGSAGSMCVVTGEYADQPGTACVIGMHIVSPDASDLIAEGQQLIANRIPLHDAASNIHAHPTLSEMVGEALLKADGRPFNTR